MGPGSWFLAPSVVEGTCIIHPVEYDRGNLSHINTSIKVKKKKSVTLSKSPVKVTSQSYLIKVSYFVSKTTNTTHKTTKTSLSTGQ